ncbi:MAG TPA: CBS domain-containing protein [Gemmatimonadaceae bacterium]|nr:CBS domain-containing protein [Gemmatimonadaceae bacterium]
MKIRDVMTKSVETIRPDANLIEAADRMRALDVGPLPVAEGDRVVGLITDRDIVIRAIALGRDPRSTTVQSVMSQGVESCRPDDDVKKAAELMRDKQIRRLVVLDDKGKLQGILALGDLAVDTDDKMAGDTLEGISEPSQPATH